ncbi:3-oxoacyl-[acyl-carrier-protein] synthase-3 [Streptomyces sp. 1114.5]|uniref:3-oxoacyl-[acyl-carrier-protein] synthase III C-terminal domain-containing protein n=1 Tax=Streptomyces sp. 1114.5 TaxID=1938830 RepID=UPI000EB454C7|nr:3-oxoacyl-[acyl-carrier-protein] synthase III C-terminal domain-containing protein [Streptomyces sp. 1114.5]RKT12290.1 3-oxoacyl-[acyl-carrier-protein] synthase-3 [Streptomyces sp. 1114.5]
MSALQLSALAYVHGERRPIAELADRLAPELLAPDTGLAWYRASEREIWQLAAEAGARTVEAAVEPPDLLVYVSENDHGSSDSLTHLVRALGLPATRYLRVSGHDCGNLGPALHLAGQALASGEHRRVLLLMADRVLDGDRSQADTLSVVSDGAVACLVTAGEPDGGTDDELSSDGVRFAVHGVSTVTDAEAGAGAGVGDRILATVALAVAGTAEIARQCGRAAEDFDHLLFPNYRTVAQQFLCSAMGVPVERVLFGPMAEYGHCFSADSLVSLAHCAERGGIRPGEHVLAFGDGPNSWSSLAVERIA